MHKDDYQLDYPKAVVGEIKLGALNPEDALVFALTVTLFKQFGPGPTYGLVTSLFTIWAYRKATAGQPPNYLAYKMSCLSPELFEIPLVGPLFRTASRLMKKVWIDAGSIPPHTLVKRYER